MGLNEEMHSIWGQNRAKNPVIKASAPYVLIIQRGVECLGGRRSRMESARRLPVQSEQTKEDVEGVSAPYS